MRAFVAVDLPEDLMEALERLQSDLRTGRIVAPDNLHLTLAFLGDAGDDALELLHDDLTTLHRIPVTLRITGLDIFGSATAPRLVVAMVDDTPALTDLHHRITRVARAAGLDLDRRRFRPHVTLARFGKTARADPQALARFLADHGGFTTPAIAARSMGLYASTLTPHGAEYEALATYPLAHPPAYPLG
ncbi:2'-5'-RNA ligase [Marinibacterium anthonyi]|nr:2'-5'-RNA ligase [Marinibacterium anthonyi]